MSFHKRFTNQRDLVRRHLNRSPTSDISHRAVDLASLLSSLAQAEIRSAESSAEAAHAHTSIIQPTASDKAATNPVVTPIVGVPNVAMSPALPVTAVTTSTASVASKVVSLAPVVPVVVVNTPSTFSSSTISPITFTPPQPTSLSLTISPPVPSAESAQNQGQSHSKGVSSGVIGAIVAIIVLLGVALVVFFARKLFMRRRAIKRNTWGAGLVPVLESKRDTVYGDVRPSQMSENSSRQSHFGFPGSQPASTLLPV